MSEFITRDGAKLKIRAVPSLVVLAIQQQCKEPSVPTWRNEEKQRDEPNPLDPTYVQAMKDYNECVGTRTTDAYLANGVTIEHLPDNVHSLESEAWAEGLKFVGLDVPDDGIGRRVAYLRWYLIGDSDVSAVISQIAVAGGVVSEEQVQQAAETFRDQQNGRVDTEVQATSGS